MPINVTCSQCNTTLKAPDNAAGRKVKCPKCGAVLAVPAAVVEAAEQVSAAPPARTRPSPPPPARRRDDDDDRGRGRRDRDRDDDYDDDRGPRRRSARDDDDYDARPARRGDEGPGTGVQLGLGIAGMVCGIIGAIFSWIPFCGAFVAWPMCGLGLVLAGTGLIIAMMKKAGYGFPIAGTAVSVVGLAVSLIWYFWFVASVRQLGDINQQIIRDLNRKDAVKDFNFGKDLFQKDGMKDLFKDFGKDIPFQDGKKK